jgi:hypothetical protein
VLQLTDTADRRMLVRIGPAGDDSMELEWILATLLQATAIVISIVALSLSGLSCWISLRALRRSEEAESPLLSAEVRAVAGQSDWYEVKLMLKSRSTYGWQADLIEFTWGTKALTSNDAHEVASEGRRLKSPLPSEQARRRLPIRFAVTAAGRPVPMRGMIKMGDGEHHHETLFVYSRSILSRRLSMWVRLRSKESIERLSVIELRRMLPHAASTARPL